MNAEQLKTLQAPLKQQYRDDAASAVIHLQRQGRIDEGITCSVETGREIVRAGLHPAGGGDGSAACSGDMLLEALVACAGVTLNAVATALAIELRDATITASGAIDIRGTLAVVKDAAVGFQTISLNFALDTDASPEQQAKLIELTERYCVIYQTLQQRPELSVTQSSV